MKITTICSILLITLLSQCKPSGNKIRLSGSSTLAPVILDIATLYEKEHKEIQIDVQTGGSSKGVLDTRNNISSAGMISRALKSSESDLTPIVIALDGVSIVVNKLNPISNITKEQIIKIYTGVIKNWKEIVPKYNKVITVINKEEGRGTLEVFEKYTGLKFSKMKANMIIGDNAEGLKAVASNSGAIAYISIGAALDQVKVGSAIKLPNIDSIESSIESVRTKKLPIRRSLSIITKKQEKISNELQNFINFTKSKEVHHIIKQHGFIPAE